MKSGKLITILAVMMGIIFLAGCSEKATPAGVEGLRSSPFEVVGWVDTPAAPYGVCWDGEYRWITVRGNNPRILALPPDGENPIATFNSPSSMPSGIAYHNGMLWVTDADSEYIYVISRYDGGIQNLVPDPVSNNSGICWVNDKLYMCDWIAGTIRRYDSNMNLEKTFYGTYPYRQFYGIGWDGSRLWVGDYTRGRAYTFDLDLNPLNYGDPYFSPDYHPTGWAWDGSHLLNTDTGADRLYKTNPPPPAY